MAFTYITSLQRAVNGVLEEAVSTFLDKSVAGERSVPSAELPALLRAAIAEESEHPEETRILQHVLTLLEQGNALEQREFFAALSWSFEESGNVRVAYEPQNTIVN